jgi:hypothetical protein
MSDTYSLPGGSSTQNTQLQSLLETLNSMPNMSPEAASAINGYVQSATDANTQNYTNAQQQAVVSNPAVTAPAQSYANDADLFKMFAADHQLAQTYTNPAFAAPGQPTTQAADMPTTPGLATPEMPVATPTSLAQGFTGFTNPANAYAAAHLQNTGVNDTLSTIQKLLDFNLGQLNKTAATNVDSQKSLSNEFLNLVKTAISNNPSGSQTQADKTAALISQATNDAKSGTTLNQLMIKYKALGLDPNDIYSTYNLVNSDPNRKSNFGPAKEDPATLASWGVTIAKTSTADQKVLDSQKTAGTVTSTIQNILDQFSALSPGEKGFGPGNIATALPWTGAAEYEKQRMGLAATLKDLAGAGAGSGVRVNNVELRNWSNLLPSPSKTPQQSKIDIISLQKQLISKFGQGLDQAYLDQFGITSNDLKQLSGKNTPTPGVTPTQTQYKIIQVK